MASAARLDPQAEQVQPALDDVRWCAALAEALSACCLVVTAARLAEVRALLADLPAEMLPGSWVELADQARAWAEGINARRCWDAPVFPGFRQIGLAMREAPMPVPAWAQSGRFG